MSILDVAFGNNSDQMSFENMKELAESFEPTAQSTNVFIHKNEDVLLSVKTVQELGKDAKNIVLRKFTANGATWLTAKEATNISFERK